MPAPQDSTLQTPSDNLLDPTKNRDEFTQELISFRESDQGKKLVDWCLKQYQSCKNRRSGLESQWAINLGYYNRSDSSTDKNPYGSSPNNKPQPGTKKVRVNRIRSIIRTELAKLTSQMPNVSVAPATGENEDMLAAEAAEQVIDSYLHRDEVVVAFKQASFWQSVAGNGFVKAYWNPESIDPVQIKTPVSTSLDGEETTDPEVPEGDIDIQSVTPFHLLVPNLLQEELEKQPYLIHLNILTVNQVKLQYEKELAGKEPKASMVSSEDILSGTTMNTTSDSQPDSVPVAEFWLKPGAHEDFPEGALITLVGNILVGFQSVFPYRTGRYPFAHLQGIPTGTFYCSSTIEDLIPLQIEYNANRSLIANARNIMGKPQLLAAKGSISAAKITNTYGLVIEYKPGLPAPQPMPIAQLPGYIENETQIILTDMEDLSGQHQVSKGSTPAGVTAATAISFLGERDDAYISTYYKSVEKAVEKIARQVLGLAVQYWDVPRLIKVVGADSYVDVIYVRNIDLRNNTDVRTDANSNVPQSRAARKAELNDMVLNGIISPEQFLELNDIGGVNRVTDVIQIDRKHAQRENTKFKNLNVQELDMLNQEWEARMEEVRATVPEDQLQQLEAMGHELVTPPLAIPVNEWDEHEVHIKYHNMFRKSQEYEGLEPQVQDQIDRHVKMHEQKKQEKMLRDMLSMVPTDGSVPGIMGVEGADGNISAEDVSPEDSMMNESAPAGAPMGEPMEETNAPE